MNQFKQIPVPEAQRLIQSRSVTIVDIRDPHSFEAGHINQALLVGDQNIEDFLQQAPKDKPLICYCYHGISSQNAAQFFCENGFQDVYSIEGGYEAWRQTSF